MMMNATLKARRIAVLAADGFEKVELTIPVAALRMAGAAVNVISVGLPQPLGEGGRSRKDMPSV